MSCIAPNTSLKPCKQTKPRSNRNSIRIVKQECPLQRLTTHRDCGLCKTLAVYTRPKKEHAAARAELHRRLAALHQRPDDRRDGGRACEQTLTGARLLFFGTFLGTDYLHCAAVVISNPMPHLYRGRSGFELGVLRTEDRTSGFEIWQLRFACTMN